MSECVPGQKIAEFIVNLRERNRIDPKEAYSDQRGRENNYANGEALALRKARAEPLDWLNELSSGLRRK